jgi:dTDP-4-amino-4,6-dideoxygalactose transaminase
VQVPFLDLKAQYQTISGEIGEAIGQVLESTAFAGGPFVKQFEDSFAPYCQCQHAVGVSNGTTALWVALKCLGIRPGDEVITVPNTFIATAEAISFCGATPVFVDIDASTHTIDPEQIEQAITPLTRAIVPVHLYGQMADMDPIMDIARRYGLVVVEDAAQAHGAEYKGRRAGSIGHAGCFSFYPGKNLGAYGEAGAVVTNNQALAEAMRVLRDHGQSKKYYHSVIGWNARMCGIQGAVLSVKMRYIEEWTEKRRRNAALYSSLLEDVEGILPPAEADYARHVYHIYPICMEDRDEVMETLKQRGVTCGIHYPLPVHLQDAYAGLGYSTGAFPVTEKVAKELISLPMYAELSEDQIHHVVQQLRAVSGCRVAV